jgi:hypothetical protein
MAPGADNWPPFHRLVRAQAAHAGGDGMVAVALADTLFFSVPVGEARDQVVLYLALTMAPFAVLSPFIGPLLDRSRDSYRIAVALAAGGRALLAVLLSTRTDTLTLYPLAFGLLVLSRVHGVCRSALVPAALPPERSLMWANAWLAVVSVAAGAAGAGLAAGSNALAGPRLSLLAAAAAFAAAVVPALGLPGREGEVRRLSRGEAYRQLLSVRLLSGGVAMAASRAAVGFLTFLLAFVLRRQGHGAGGLAVAVAAGGVGGFLGSVAAPALRAVLRESLLLFATLAAMGGVALWAAAAFDLTAAAAVAGVVGFGAGAGRLAFDSLLQGDAPEALRARTFARYETIFQLWWVGGSLAATAVPFTAAGGLRALAAICLGGAALSAWGLLRPAPPAP